MSTTPTIWWSTPTLARVQRLTDLSIPTGGVTVTWDLELDDTDNMFAGPSTLITCQRDGLFMCTVNLEFDYQATNNRIMGIIQKVGAPAASPLIFSLCVETAVSASVPLWCFKGNTLALILTSLSGFSRTLKMADYTPMFTVCRIS